MFVECSMLKTCTTARAPEAESQVLFMIQLSGHSNQSILKEIKEFYV